METKCFAQKKCFEQNMILNWKFIYLIKKNLSRLMGISTLKPVSTNIENWRRNRRKSVEKPRKNRMNLKKKALTRIIFNQILFSIKIPIQRKMRFRRYCICSEILTKNIMRKFLFFKGFSSISLPVFNISKNSFQRLNSI